MGELKGKIDAASELTYTKRRKTFVPAGQSTQMIIGADQASDATILGTSANLYGSYALRRVYYSAFSPIPDSSKALPLIKLAPRPGDVSAHRIVRYEISTGPSASH